MADSYDAMYEAHLLDVEWSSYEEAIPIFKCRKGGKLKARLALSGAVEHRCPKCQHGITQTPEEYRAALNRQDGRYLEVDCPQVVMYRSKRGRVR